MKLSRRCTASSSPKGGPARGGSFHTSRVSRGFTRSECSRGSAPGMDSMFDGCPIRCASSTRWAGVCETGRDGNEKRLGPVFPGRGVDSSQSVAVCWVFGYAGTLKLPKPGWPVSQPHLIFRPPRPPVAASRATVPCAAPSTGITYSRFRSGQGERMKKPTAQLIRLSRGLFSGPAPACGNSQTRSYCPGRGELPRYPSSEWPPRRPVESLRP